MVSLQVSNLVKKYILSPKQQKINQSKNKIKVAVNNLSFVANGGEIYGLLGPNGAGKTTTLRIISTLIKATSGSVLINNKDILKNPIPVKKEIAFLTSELKLDNFFTPNYLFDYYAGLYGVSKDTIEARKKILFDKLGINSFREIKIGSLSTGMKQKVSIAISLAHDPQVIIYDEPTNGLDVLTAKLVTDYLLELKKEGKCIIISTHIFSLVEKICDKVGIIIDGKLVKEGSLTEIKAGLSLEDRFFEIYSDIKGGQNE